MRATSMSINLYGGCDARCPFCIASTTWKTGIKNNRRLEMALPKALDYARYHGVDTVLVTGSGEPTLHRDLVLRVARKARELGIPAVELQTNGATLATSPSFVGELFGHGVTTIALSVASVDPSTSAATMGIEHDYLELAAELDRLGFLCRISLNLVKDDRQALLERLPDYARTLTRHGVRQLTLRQLGVPDRPESSPEALEKIAWVGANALGPDDVATVEREVTTHGQRLRSLSYGADVYDYHELSVVVTTCASDRTAEDEIRSFILQPDGHVYHSWNYRGSVLL
jgi:pyruvate-formate lyase-activating enzyme